MNMARNDGVRIAIRFAADCFATQILCNYKYRKVARNDGWRIAMTVGGW